MKKIGSLTPTITSPETMEAQCQFQFVYAHGETMMKQLMIVPKDTFLLFVGASGYYTSSSIIKRGLILTNGFPNKEGYLQNLYNTFFSPEDMTGKGTRYAYEGAQVYTPGDIIHDTNLSFHSGNDQGQAFFYGYHTLPITDPPAKSYNYPADPHTYRTMLAAKTFYVPFISTAVARGLLTPTQSATLSIKSEVQDQWNTLVTIKDYEKAIDEILRLSTSQPKVYDISYWFNTPDKVMKYIITPYERSHPNNKLHPFPPVLQPLSALLEEYPNTKISSSKQYRFVIILACRGPDVNIGKFHNPDVMNTYYQGVEPKQLTLASGPQKLARRMSFSAKQPAESCPIGVGANPMNLASVKKAMEDIAPFIKNYDEATYPKEYMFLRLIYESFFKIKKTTKVKILKKGELLSYDITVGIHTFLQAIDMSIQTFPLLVNEDPSVKDKQQRFQNVVVAFQNMIRAYAVSAAINDPMDPTHTIGEHIYKQILSPDKAHLAPVRLGYREKEIRENMRQGIQTKLLRKNEGIEVIRPITNEMSEHYSELLTIFPMNNTILREYKEKIAPLMRSISEEGYQAINKVWDTYLTTSNTILIQVNDIQKKLEKNKQEINSLIKRYPGISTLFFSEFDPRFKENPKLATFSVPKACEALLGDCSNIRLTMASLRTKIDYDKRVYTKDINIVREKYKTVIQALNDETNAIKNYETSVKTFIQRKQAFQATIQQTNQRKPIPEKTYQSIMEGLTTLLEEMKDFDKENDILEIMTFIVTLVVKKDYEDIIKNQPIESYAPEFRSPYTNMLSITAYKYYKTLSRTIHDFNMNLTSNIYDLEHMIETYTNQYTTQQRLSAKGTSTQTRKNKPQQSSMVRGASNSTANHSAMVSGASGAPKPNQTRKKNRPVPAWVIKMHERQAKRNQTKRNGNKNSPVIPTL